MTIITTLALVGLMECAPLHGQHVTATAPWLEQQSSALAEADRLVEQLRGLPTPIPSPIGKPVDPDEERRWRVIAELRGLGSPAIRALACGD